MAGRSASDVGDALLAKGMELDENHHHMYRKTVAGVTTIVTRISHNSKAIHDALGKKMANQCVLQLSEFWELVDCTLDEEAWNKLIEERCVDGKNPFMNR